MASGDCSQTIECALEAGEQVDHVGSFEHAVALACNVALSEDAGGLESVDGLTGSHLRASDQPGGALDGDHWDAWEKVEEELDGRIGADSDEPLAPCGRERVDPSRVGVGVGARTCCRRSERAQPLVGAS